MTKEFLKKNVLFYVLLALLIIVLITFLFFYPRSSKLSNQTNLENNLVPDNSNITNTASSVPAEIFMPATSSLNISPVGLANPASVNCEKVGGKLVINKDGGGGEYGLCYFEENRACEEWALLRGDCPWGGRKTTGFDTEAQRYCAWRGGETFAVENAVCKFKDGSSCLDEDLYNGLCSPGQNK